VSEREIKKGKRARESESESESEREREKRRKERGKWTEESKEYSCQLFFCLLFVLKPTDRPLSDPLPCTVSYIHGLRCCGFRPARLRSNLIVRGKVPQCPPLVNTNAS
jgi:hypothetical protein